MSVELIDELAHKTGQQGASVLSEADGIVEAFVSGIGNKDHVGDIVEPGAFNSSLRRRKPRVIWGHEWNRPIGKVLEIFEVGAGDPRLPEQMQKANIGGLYVKVQFNLLTESGREAFANVAFYGEEQQWSIGYKTVRSAYDAQVKANRLQEVELFEVSPVLHGANQLTSTVSIKTADTADFDTEEAAYEENVIHSLPANGVDVEIDEKGHMMMSPGSRMIKDTDDYMILLIGGRCMLVPKMKVGGETYFGTPKPVDIQPVPLVQNTKPTPAETKPNDAMPMSPMNADPEKGGGYSMVDEDDLMMKDQDEEPPTMDLKVFGVEIISEVDQEDLTEKMLPFNVTVNGKTIVFNSVEAEAATKQFVAAALESLGVTEIKPFRTSKGTN